MIFSFLLVTSWSLGILIILNRKILFVITKMFLRSSDLPRLSFGAIFDRIRMSKYEFLVQLIWLLKCSEMKEPRSFPVCKNGLVLYLG